MKVKNLTTEHLVVFAALQGRKGWTDPFLLASYTAMPVKKTKRLLRDLLKLRTVDRRTTNRAGYWTVEYHR